jgi:hypothetical protein
MNLTNCIIEVSRVDSRVKVNLPNFIPVGILLPNMNNLYAHNHHHHTQLPYGREVYVRVPVTQ